jgi:hypothetical protein
LKTAIFAERNKSDGGIVPPAKCDLICATKSLAFGALADFAAY